MLFSESRHSADALTCQRVQNFPFYIVGVTPGRCPPLLNSESIPFDAVPHLDEAVLGSVEVQPIVGLETLVGELSQSHPASILRQPLLHAETTNQSLHNSTHHNHACARWARSSRSKNTLSTRIRRQVLGQVFHHLHVDESKTTEL